MLADKLRAMSASKYARVVTGALTTSGTCDITYSGGGTCDGAIIFVSQATSLDTNTDHASMSVCFFDGTTAYSAGYNSKDAQNSTATQSALSTSLLIAGISATAQDGEGSVATITDGIRITWSNPPSAGFSYVAVLFFGGVSLQAGYITINRFDSGTSTYTAADFTASAGLFFNLSFNTFSGSTTNSTGALFGMGAFSVSDSNITQRCFAIFDTNGRETSTIKAYASDLGVRVSVDGVSYAEVTEVNSTGFTLTTRGTGPATRQSIFMLLGGITAASLDDTAVPASTGVKSWDGPGFQPDFILSAVSGFNTYNSESTSEDVNLAIGVHDGTTGGGVAVWCKNDADTSDTGSRTNSTPFLQSHLIDQTNQASQSEPFAAQFDSFDAAGYNFNYTEVTSGLLGFTLALDL